MLFVAVERAGREASVCVVDPLVCVFDNAKPARASRCLSPSLNRALTQAPVFRRRRHPNASRRWSAISHRHVTSMGSGAGSAQHPDMNANRLLARESEAREELCRLRDCSREIERVAAMVRSSSCDPYVKRIGLHVRSCTVELARLRVELRTWDLAAPFWIQRLHTRVDCLAEQVSLLAQVKLAAGRAERSPEGTERQPPTRPLDQAERTIRDYLYPRPAALPVVG